MATDQLRLRVTYSRWRMKAALGLCHALVFVDRFIWPFDGLDCDALTDRLAAFVVAGMSFDVVKE